MGQERPNDANIEGPRVSKRVIDTSSIHKIVSMQKMVIDTISICKTSARSGSPIDN